ncbi:MAG: DUF2637 domain-containing protein [Rhodococcus sp. (in: high G+C Gram-positive bacteria)]|uniref:DUF2637 domain-containing protein n=1 Tax=Rhodococcus sp. EPR-157 TaxID=1813677 RepID=UPI0007BB8C81|nr:DUF2637 domain-containing protein [Rhodococcus sp. EPR-157]KZF08027.1 excisionase [Rhodococcus sp. EPR-157]
MNKVLRATLASAVVITTVIGIASFVLSFAALWDLATMAGVPRSLSWLWPVIVDGTILQATISVIALAQFEDQRSGRRFFWAVLVIAALVSIGANAMHAFISQAGTLHPALSATIATVAPVSLLAATHGLGILVRLPALGPSEASSARGEASTQDAPAVPKPPVPKPPVPKPPVPISPAPDPDPDPGEAPVREDSAMPALQDERLSDLVAERLSDPLADVDRWILDEDRSDDLYPVDAP